MPNYKVAKQTGLSSLSVGRWRQRFVEHRLHGLLDLPRSGAPRTISDEKVAEVVRTTLEQRPKNATHWSTRSLGKRLGLSHDSIARVWKAFGLQPHRHEHFQFSTDPEFVDKVGDVVGLYMSPPQNAVRLWIFPRGIASLAPGLGFFEPYRLRFSGLVPVNRTDPPVYADSNGGLLSDADIPQHSAK